ncbi:DNA mismatch repair protein [Diplocarpon rosae]|nr:DNA mismatch repair protein [Diplocarpon rosae]
MAIRALPQATVRLLGSAQALTTPTSLVKELVDNALDAQATSIDILVSPNTIDKIEVRDNGHGIPKEDLDSLGRRGHTSKLRSFEELQSIGGVTLGFRGEALASAVQLGQVSVTTRIDGEPVATIVQLKAPGGVASRSRTSHPIGTTVSVSKFLSNLPVRKQTAEKESAKTLKKIKELLCSYALARPRVRFCLKITKGGKGSWSYTPRPNDGVKGALSQIIGRDAAAQCIERSLVFSDEGHQSIDLKGDGLPNPVQYENLPGSMSNNFVVEVSVPKPGATLTGHGQYISVDSRPVSHKKGTMRKIVTSFTYYAKISLLRGEESLKGPFLWLNLKCPVLSYDPNVEPAKDDILFGNEHLILGSIERLFKEIYGESVATSPATSVQTFADKHRDFELLMSRTKATPGGATTARRYIESAQFPDSSGLQNSAESPTAKEPGNLEEPVVLVGNGTEGSEAPVKRKWSVDMSKDYGGVVEDFQIAHRCSRNSARGHNRTTTAANIDTALNPWIIAKLNAPVLPRNNNLTPSPPTSISKQASPVINSHLPTPQSSSAPLRFNIDSLFSNSPSRPRQNLHDGGTRMLEQSTFPALSPRPTEGPDNQVDISRLIRWPSIADSDNGLLPTDDSKIARRRNEFSSAREVLSNTIPIFTTHIVPEKLKSINKPFVPPIRTIESTLPRHEIRQSKLRTTFGPPQSQTTSLYQEQDRSSNTELAWAMDFEQRKEDATRRRRMEIAAARAELDVAGSKKRQRLGEDEALITHMDSGFDAGRCSPHKNRYNAAVANLEASGPKQDSHEAPRKPFKTTLPDGDPRAYLMKRQNSMHGLVNKPGEVPKQMRAKSVRLPLERIPEGGNVHMLMLECSIHIGLIQNALSNTTSLDSYTNEGFQPAGLLMNAPEAKMVEKRVHAIVEKWRATEAGEKYEIDYNFDNLVDMK